MLGGYNVETKKAYVNDLIVLCNMIDSFSGFSSDFYELMKMNCEIDVVIKLCNVGVTVKDNKKFFDFKNMRIIKDFYQKHKDEINIINKYSSLWDFLYYNYDGKGNLTTGELNGTNFAFFYQYFLDNKNQLGQMLLTLEKIKSLGIIELEFNELENFTEQEFWTYTDFFLNDNFEYLENMEVISNYDEKKVRYRSLESNYKIVVNNYDADKHKIVVNNLLFDSSKLPKDLSEKVIFADIKKFLDEHGEEWSRVRAVIDDSVYLSIAIDDLIGRFYDVNDVVQSLENIERKGEVLAILYEIKERLEKLKEINEEISDSICDDLIAKDEMRKVKNKHLLRRVFRRRRWY